MNLFAKKGAPSPPPEPPELQEPRELQIQEPEQESAAPLDPAPAPAQLRPLAPGSYLPGDLEIKALISQGAINCYDADAGDWGSPDPRLVFQQATEQEEAITSPEALLFPPAERFVQDGCEYAVWPRQSLTPLADWRPPANDLTYIECVLSLAQGLAALEEAHLTAELDGGLGVDDQGHLRYFGFFAPEAEEATPALETLTRLATGIAKNNLAHGATLRLDDEFASLPFSEEVKEFGRALRQGRFATVQAAAEALQAFAPVTVTQAALLSDIGLQRELNEDAGLLGTLRRAGHLHHFDIEYLAVADGMGGHEGGEVASDLTLNALEQALARRWALNWNDNGCVRSALGEILEEVNSAVVAMNQDPPYSALRNKPGSTLVCALRLGSRLFIGNVGDSRAYRWSARAGLEQLTRDHSYVQDLIDSGRLAQEDAWGHPDGSIITSHIGLPRGGKRDVFLRLLRPDDKILLVSDGVVDMLRDSEIAAIAGQEGTASQLCSRLVEAANDAGGGDNITVVALLCASGEYTSHTLQER
jgi:protein phosphatase